MSSRGKRAFVRTTIYCLLLSGIVWQGIRILRHIRQPRPIHYGRYVTVAVNGNVNNPGTYRVPEGTSHFEILKIVGVRPTSDISTFDLARQVNENDNLTVGILENSVSLKEPRAGVRLEFFFGDVAIISGDGRTKPRREGMSIDEGDRIQTEANAQAEFSVSSYSRVDIDKFSEIVFDKIGSIEENKVITRIYHRDGVGWYKMVPASGDELLKVVIHGVELTTTGSGADFAVETSADHHKIHNMSGLLLVERSEGEEALNLIAGQSMTVYNDNRPFQVSQIPADIKMQERFAELEKEKTEFMMRHMPLNFLLCGPGGLVYFLNMQFETGIANAICIPGATAVDQYAEGFSTLAQAFLYGGAVYVSTMIEQMMNTRITHYAVFSRDAVIRTASAIGGISVPVDDAAASHLGISAGTNKLKGEDLAKFMGPGISGKEFSHERQMSVLMALFNNFRSRNIILTALLADQIIANIETNFSSLEIMKHYNRFVSRANWSFRSHVLPVTREKVGAAIREIPDLEKAREIIYGQG